MRAERLAAEATPSAALTELDIRSLIEGLDNLPERFPVADLELKAQLYAELRLASICQPST
jgi:hypothetical protein